MTNDSQSLISFKFNGRIKLEGANLLLQPMQESDFEALYQVASDPNIWAMHPAKDRYKREVFYDFFRSGVQSEMAYIIKDKHKDNVIGSSRFNNPDYDNSSVEIGWTFLNRSYWGGMTNAELKDLMLHHAFSTFDKVHFCIGENNLRSICAVQKLGAYKQPDIIDQSRSDSVFYEITPQTYKGLRNYGL